MHTTLALACVFVVTGCGFEIAAQRTDAAAEDATVGDGITADTMLDGASAVDTDGDGLLDAVDNCPAIANADQRNWDQDAAGDVCDGCPHIAAEGGDGDGDGVPDACDPRPTMGGDTRLLWRGFYDATDISGWTVKSGTWAVSNGVLAQSSTQLAELLPPMNYQRVYVATEVEIGQMPSGGRIGACSGQTGNNSDYDCCDLVIDGNGSQRVEAASTSGGQIRNPWSGSYATGARVAIVQDTLGSTNTCNFRQAATTAMATSTKDGANAQLILWSDSATASFRYLFVVQIGN